MKIFIYNILLFFLCGILSMESFGQTIINPDKKGILKMEISTDSNGVFNNGFTTIEVGAFRFPSQISNKRISEKVRFSAMIMKNCSLDSIVLIDKSKYGLDSSIINSLKTSIVELTINGHKQEDCSSIFQQKDTFRKVNSFFIINK